MGSGPNLVNTERLARVRELATAGWSASEIGADLDVKANTVQQWMRRYGIESGWSPPAITHGTRAGYARGCRCEPCTRASTACVLAYQARVRAEDARRDLARGARRWERWEDEVVLDSTRSHAEISALLGRSRTAVRMRRSALRSAGRAYTRVPTN